MLAGLAAFVMAALGVSTAVGAALLPASWTWAHDRVIVWLIVGGLLVLAVTLAMITALREAGFARDLSGPQASLHIRGTAVGGVGAVVVTGPGPVFIGHQAPPGSPGGAGQIVAGEIPARPPAFLERAAAAELAQAWEAGLRVAVVQAVTGGPGVGKTQAAAAYARARSAEGWPLVAWVTAETPNQLLAGLTNVAAAVGVADDNGDSAVSAKNVRRYLETFPGPALVVFDNATDVDGLATFLPTVGATQVVITSRDRAFSRLGLTVDVGLFTPEQSVAYLTERTGLTGRDAAGQVAAELGYLPLALAQAATVISQQSLDYVTYQQRLHQAPAARYLTRHAGDPYPQGAAEAIALAVRNVEDRDESGLTRLVMRLLSVLSAEGVDRFVLARLADLPVTAEHPVTSPGVSAEAVDSALGRLVAGSILTRSSTGQAFSMHRLVSRVVREREGADGRLLATVRVAADLLVSLEVPSEEGWRRRQAGSHLVEQVSAVWAAASALAGSGDSGVRELTVQLMALRNWSVSQLTVAADLPRAMSLGAVVLADGERLLGPDHPGTLAARANLALAYAATGRPREAIPLLERNLADQERLLGPDHLSTLSTRAQLAVVYKEAGRLREAVSLFERNLADRERILGSDHPDTLAARDALAMAYRGMRRMREVTRLLERNLADRERVLGADHPDTLAAYQNLAAAYMREARRGAGVRLYERNLADRERVLGSDHPDTLTARHNLALAYLRSYRRRAAIALLERNLADRKRVLGDDHPDTLTARDGLAGARRRREAVALHQRSLADRERLLGPDHPQTLLSRQKFATALWSAGRFRKAIMVARQNATEAGYALEAGPDRTGYRVYWVLLLLMALVPALLVAGFVGLILTGKGHDAAAGLAVVIGFVLLFMLMIGVERLFARLGWDPPRLP